MFFVLTVLKKLILKNIIKKTKRGYKKRLMNGTKTILKKRKKSGSMVANEDQK